MNCPCCPNHCQINSLKCDKGKNYFAKSTNEIKDINEEIKENLRKCGHILHHNQDLDLSILKDTELKELNNLLSKINN